MDPEILLVSDTQQLPGKEIFPSKPVRARALLPSAPLSPALGKGGGGESTTHHPGGAGAAGSAESLALERRPGNAVRMQGKC